MQVQIRDLFPENLISVSFISETPAAVSAELSPSVKAYITGYPALPTAGELEQIVWFLDEYPEHPVGPLLSRAVRSQKLIRDLGARLYQEVFSPGLGKSDNSEWLGTQDLADLDFLVIDSPYRPRRVFWQLMRSSPERDPLATGAKSFCSVVTSEEETESESPMISKDLRVLIVICRPEGSRDIPLRSVASSLIQLESSVQLTVLNTPTLQGLKDELSRTLEDPYDVVHFDGHGAVINRQDLDRKKIGVVAFERPSEISNTELVDGRVLGRLIAEAGTPILVLNACESAALASGGFSVEEDRIAAAITTSQSSVLSTSFAEDAASAGIACVLGMQFSISVSTAAFLVGEFYAALGTGLSPNAAVRQARVAQLERSRAAVPGSAHSEDWLLPIQFQGKGSSWGVRTAKSGRRTRDSAEPALIGHGIPNYVKTGIAVDSNLFGLDRSLRLNPAVFLCGLRGSGKTRLAVEAALWFSRTGGFELAHRKQSNAHSVYIDMALADDLSVFLELLTEASPKLSPVQGGEGPTPISVILDNLDLRLALGEGVWSEDEQRELYSVIRSWSLLGTKAILITRITTVWPVGEVSVIPTVWVSGMSLAASEELLLERLSSTLRSLMSGTTVGAQVAQLSRGNPRLVEQIAMVLNSHTPSSGDELQILIDELHSAVMYGMMSKGGSDLALLCRNSLMPIAKAIEKMPSQIISCLRYFPVHFDSADIAHLKAVGQGRELASVTRAERDDLGQFTPLIVLGLCEQTDGFHFRTHPALVLLLSYFLGSSANEKIARGFVEWASNTAATFNEDYSRKRDPQAKIQIRMRMDTLYCALHLSIYFADYLAVARLLLVLSHVTTWKFEELAWRKAIESVASVFLEPDGSRPEIAFEERVWESVAGVLVRQMTHSGRMVEALRLQTEVVRSMNVKGLALESRIPEALSAPDAMFLRDYARALRSLAEVIRFNSGKAEKRLALYTRALKIHEIYGDARSKFVVMSDLARVYGGERELRDLDMAESMARASLAGRAEDDFTSLNAVFTVLARVYLERYLSNVTKVPLTRFGCLLVAKDFNDSAFMYADSHDLRSFEYTLSCRCAILVELALEDIAYLTQARNFLSFALTTASKYEFYALSEDCRLGFGKLEEAETQPA